MLSRMNETARADLSSVNAEWFGAFEQSLKDPARREAWRADPDLKAVVDEVERAESEHVSFDPAAGSKFSLSSYRRTRSAIDRVERVRQGLLPEHWKKLADTVAVQQKYESRHWDQPATFLSQLVRGTQPAPGSDVAAGVDRFLRVQPRVEAGGEAAEAVWRQFEADLQPLDKTGDKVLAAFADYFRNSTALIVRFTDDGVEGLDDVKAMLPLAGRLAEVVAKGWPDAYGRERLARDVESTLNTVQPKEEDIKAWLAAVDGYALVQLGDESQPVASLTKGMKKLTADVARQPLSDAERAPFEPIRAELDAKIRAFRAARFVKKDINQGQGEVAVRWSALQREMDALRKEWVKLEDPREWVAEVGQPIAATSEQIKARWKAWTDALKSQADALAADQPLFARTKKATEELKAALSALDQDFPPVPLGLSEAFASAAWDKRESELEALTQWAVPRPGRDARDRPRPAGQDGRTSGRRPVRGLVREAEGAGEGLPHRQGSAHDGRPPRPEVGDQGRRLLERPGRPEAGAGGREAAGEPAGRGRRRASQRGEAGGNSPCRKSCWPRGGGWAPTGDSTAVSAVSPPWPTQKDELDAELRCARGWATCSTRAQGPRRQARRRRWSW